MALLSVARDARDYCYLDNYSIGQNLFWLARHISVTVTADLVLAVKTNISLVISWSRHAVSVSDFYPLASDDSDGLHLPRPDLPLIIKAFPGKKKRQDGYPMRAHTRQN